MKRVNTIGVLGLTLTLIVAAALVPSCRQKPAISNQVIVTGIGVDQRKGRYQLSIQAVDSLKTAGSLSEQSESATAVYHAESNSVAQALQEFLNETGRSTYILHNQIISLGMEQYRNTSLFRSLDYFVRNLEGRALVELILCRGDPAELLKIESGNDAIPSEYVSQLLKEGKEWGIAVNARLLDAERASSGMYDAVLPIMSVEEKTPRLDGTALFRDGYLVGELSVAQTTGLLFAAGEIDKCLYTVDGITFRITDADTKLQIQLQDDRLTYAFEIGGKADIVETEGELLVGQQNEAQWMARLEDAICSDVLQAIEIAIKNCRCDPLALARRTAKQYTATSQAQAAERLPNSEFSANATIRLIESGFLS